MTPRIKDNDRGDITAEIEGREIRGWSYASEAERRQKIRMAQEFAEGWYQAVQDAKVGVEVSGMSNLAEQLKDVADFLEALQRLDPQISRSPDGDVRYLLDEHTVEAFKDDAEKFHGQLMERIRDMEGNEK